MDNSLLTVYPTTEANWHNENTRTEGLLLRDYFAAKALSGWLTSFPGDAVHPVASGVAEKIAEQAYAMADAMLEARKK